MGSMSIVGYHAPQAQTEVRAFVGLVELTLLRKRAPEQFEGPMKRCQTLIRNELGLHLRAAGSFVRLASQFESQITVATPTSPPVDGKSILGLATQGAAKGTELILTADGPDEDAAMATLVAHIEDFFGEGK